MLLPLCLLIMVRESRKGNELLSITVGVQIADGWRPTLPHCCFTGGRQYRRPPTKQMEQALQKNLVDEEALEIIFFPTEEYMELYPLLIAAPPDGAPPEHPQRRCQGAAMPMLYLRHSRDWALCKPFILAGGLGVLTEQLADPNLYLRSQALESLARLTAEQDAFDWIALQHDLEPPRPPGAPPSAEARRLSKALFLLSHQDVLVKYLLGNREGSYPGGSWCALRLLAFFLSWLRLLHTPDRLLYLSDALLSALRLWQEMEGIPEEEKGLAKTLLEDFGRFPSAEQRSSQLQASQRLLQGAKGGGSTHTFSHTQEADPAHVVGAHWRIAEEEEGEGEGEPLHAKTGEDKKVEEEKAEEESGEAAAARKAEEEALALKEEGNRLLAAGDVLGAEKRFSSALALAPDNAAMLLNRSLARLKLAETQGNNTALSGALSDARDAARLHSDNPKAHFRMGKALLGLGQLSEALAAAKKAAQLQPGDAGISGLLSDVKSALQRRKAELQAEEAKRRAADVDELD